MRTIPEAAEDIINILNKAECAEEYNGDTLCEINELIGEILIINSNNERKQMPMQVREIHVDEYYCPACGSENDCAGPRTVEHKFCPECGQALRL